MIEALKKGWVQQQIADASYRFQQEVDSGERGFIGVNKYVSDEPLEISILEMDPQGESRHLERLNRVRRERDQERAQQALERLRMAAQGEHNLMEPILDCVHAYTTLGEICDVLRNVFGVHQEILVV